MAQFDVYPNPNRNSADIFPYLVDIQSPFISELGSRIVIPLARQHNTQIYPFTRLTPEITYQTETLLLFTPQISAVPLNNLKEPIGSLLHIREIIIAALDFAVSGI